MSSRTKMLTRRAMLAAGTAGLLGVRAKAVVSDASLRVRAAKRGMLYGTCAGSYQLRDGEFADVLAYEANAMVPEYELKRDTLEPRPGVFDFSGADALTDFAHAHGMKMRGHTLVWYAANPPWLEAAVTAAKNEAVFADYIASVMGRYRGRIASWDVVNEAVWPQDGRSDGLRDCCWLRRFGPGYIDSAFDAARRADPSAQLVYNDWGCEGAERWNDDFRKHTLKLLEGMKKRGVPVDAYGMQGHFRAYRPGGTLDASKLKAFLAEIRALGYRLVVSELDVDDDGGPADAKVRDAKVADITARFLAPVMESGICDAILTWGLTDRYLRGKIIPQDMWISLPRKLPLDASLRRKDMWWALAKAFR
jgi:endo-1,4-beta-xylanase